MTDEKSDNPALSRRTMLATACAATAVAAGPALAQQETPHPPGEVPQHPKGPRVFLDYDQKELDAAYEQSVYAPNREQLLARFASNSDLVRARIGTPERLAYGPTEVEQLDLYRTKRPHAPAHIFVHGGTWRLSSAKDNGFLAEIFVGAGAHFIALDFVAVPPSGGSLMPMASQVRHAIAWVWRNAGRLGIDQTRLYLSGFSSGGHLAAVALTGDWAEVGAPNDVVKGGLCCSGLYDLKPVRLSSRGRYVRLDDAQEQALSPIHHIDRLSVPLIIAYGDYETPEFQRQNREFAKAVQDAGKPVELILGTNYNHFELFETLANPYGLLGRAALAQMKLTPFSVR
jgi:arylformamidase